MWCTVFSPSAPPPPQGLIRIKYDQDWLCMSCIFGLAVLCACVHKHYQELFSFFFFKSKLSRSSESRCQTDEEKSGCTAVFNGHTVQSHVLADLFWAFPPFIWAVVPVETEAEVPFAPASPALSDVPSGKRIASCVLPTARSPAFPFFCFHSSFKVLAPHPLPPSPSLSTTWRIWLYVWGEITENEVEWTQTEREKSKCASVL